MAVKYIKGVDTLLRSLVCLVVFLIVLSVFVIALNLRRKVSFLYSLYRSFELLTIGK